MAISPEKTFLDAEEAYKRIIANLEEIYNQLEEKQKKEMFDSDFDLFKIGYDLLLQNTLLKIATSDGDVAPNEAAFLARLGDLGYDLCDFVNAFAKEAGEDITVTWPLFEKAPVDKVKAFAELIDIAISTSVKRFFGVFSFVDLLTDKDYFTLLEDDTLRISDDFLAIDFERSEKENNEALQEVKENILEPIVNNNVALLAILKPKKK